MTPVPVRQPSVLLSALCLQQAQWLHLPQSQRNYTIFLPSFATPPEFLSRGNFYFSRSPPCGGKSRNRFHPVKSRVKRTSAPRANARICLFTKCPRPPPPRPPATAPEPLRGREVGFCPSSPPAALTPNRRSSPPQSAPQTLRPSCTSLPRSCPFDPLQPTKSAAARPLIHCGLFGERHEGKRL